MYMYFPTNYVWSLAVVATLNNGGFIDEVDRACKPVLEASMNGDDAGTEELYAAWVAVADRLIASAEDDEKRGRIIGREISTTVLPFTFLSQSVSSPQRGKAARLPTRRAWTCFRSTLTSVARR